MAGEGLWEHGNVNEQSVDNPPTSPESSTSAGFFTDFSYFSDEDVEAPVDSKEAHEEDTPKSDDLYNHQFFNNYRIMEEQDQYEEKGLDDNSFEYERNSGQIMKDRRATEMELNTKMVDWSELPKDVAIKIAANHLESYEDFVTFSGVCSPWRSAAKEAANVRPTNDHQVPWLLLPPLRLDDNSSPPSHHLNRYRFYSLLKRMIRPLTNLPPAPSINYYFQGYFLSSHGWLLTKTDGLLSLLNPLSGATIKLSPFYTDNEKYRYHPSYSFTGKFALSANPIAASDYFVVVIIEFGKTVLSSKNGEPYNWTNRFVAGDDYPGYADIAFSNGELYVVERNGRVVTFPKEKNTKLALPPRLVSNKGLVEMTKKVGKFYLVELFVGRLVVVHQMVRPIRGRDMTVKFQVFEVDVHRGEAHNEVKSLGNRAIFVGYNSSFSVEAYRFDPSCKPNCIYYTDVTSKYFALSPCYPKRIDMGVYNLTDGKFEGDYYNGPKQFDSRLMPPVWVEPPSSRSIV